MHIRELRVKEFKRFSDLKVEIDSLPKLVVLVGPNGSGKSSLLEGLKFWADQYSGYGWSGDALYYSKLQDSAFNWNDKLSVTFHEDYPPDQDRRKMLYVRSAYRNESDFVLSSLNRVGSVVEGIRIQRMIDNDQRVADNYQRLVAATVEALYSGNHDETNVFELRDSLVGEIARAMNSLFPGLELEGLGDPLSSGTFYFQKGAVPRFHYKNLSGGEKAAFDLLLDLIVRRATYSDSVFCIDEPEAHISTRLQGALLDKLVELVPDGSQLWIATHAVGMLRRSTELQRTLGNVEFIDFDGVDFDQSASLSPALVNRDFWTRNLHVVLGDLAGLIAPSRVVLCEGRPADPSKEAKAEFDARCFRRVFGDVYPDTEFISVGNAADVEGDRLHLGRSIQTLVSDTTVIRLIDRDLRTDQEVADLERDGVRVLGMRNLECYLLSDEVLSLLCTAYGKSDLANELIERRESALAKAVEAGADQDDYKAVRGQMYVQARQLLNLQSPGNTAEAFLADIVAPLIVPGTQVFDDLDRAIFPRVAPGSLEGGC